jgi:hypothetical protein
MKAVNVEDDDSVSSGWRTSDFESEDEDAAAKDAAVAAKRDDEAACTGHNPRTRQAMLVLGQFLRDTHWLSPAEEAIKATAATAALAAQRARRARRLQIVNDKMERWRARLQRKLNTVPAMPGQRPRFYTAKVTSSAGNKGHQAASRERCRKAQADKAAMSPRAQRLVRGSGKRKRG